MLPAGIFKLLVNQTKEKPAEVIPKLLLAFLFPLTMLTGSQNLPLLTAICTIASTETLFLFF